MSRSHCRVTGAGQPYERRPGREEPSRQQAKIFIQVSGGSVS